MFLKTLRHFITLQIVFEKHPAPQAIVPFAPISVCQSSVEGFAVFPADEPHDLPILRLRNKGEVAEDAEAMANMKNLGENILFLLQKLK